MIHNVPFPPNYTPISPKNENATIWRFMDFTKMMSLLENQSLFFCRSDKLDDRFEGSTPLGNFMTLEGKTEPKDFEARSEERMKSRESVYINCWHLNEYESAAMWKVYAQSNHAVAIRSTIKRLRECFSDKRLVDNCIFTGDVEYLDYKKDKMPEDFVTNRFFYKRKSFEYESEIRAVLITGAVGTHKPNENGILVPVKLDVLIDDLYVGSGSPDWFLDLVKKICERYEIKKEPIRTSLDDKALF
jgi:hypothetical protein